MALKIDLRAQEPLYVGNSIITVASDERSTIIIDGTIPVIRERDYVREEDAGTPLLALIRAVQLHYLSPSATTLPAIFSLCFSGGLEHTPTTLEAMKCVADGETYKALRLLRTVV